MAFHVGSRVALGVALRLGGGQDLLVAAFRLHHLGQDEVGAAVDDAAHAADVVGGETAGDGVQDRRAAADRGFVAKGRTGGSGDRFQLGAVMGQDVLVGRDDRLAAPSAPRR